MNNKDTVEAPDKALAQHAAQIVNYCQQANLPFAQRQGYVEDALAQARKEGAQPIHSFERCG